MAETGRPAARGVLLAVSSGRAGVLRNGERLIRTAYVKQAIAGPVRLTGLGLPGDEHVYRHHGGPDMAICVYPVEHYRYWQERLDLELPEHAAFGENFTVSGLLEPDVELGNVYAVGTAVVQVTQPRTPCAKIAARYGVPKMAFFVQQQGMTGFLLRVLTEGDVEAGQAFRLIDRQGHGVTVREAHRVLNVDKRDLDGARRLLAVPGLPAALVAALQRRIERRPSATAAKLLS